MTITWTPELEIGVSAIDSEHRSIIALNNRILHLYETQADEMILERAISDFRFLFTFHFLREENFMTEIQYPYFEAHAKEHETMVDLLNKFSQRGVDNETSCLRIALLVKQWLSSHLEGADRALARYVQARDAAPPPPVLPQPAPADSG